MSVMRGLDPRIHLLRHARACRGHPRLCGCATRKAWMAGTSPAKTSHICASNRRRSQVSMLTKVARIERLAGFRLRVQFSDGSEGLRDFTTMVNEPGPMLEPLRDEKYFSRVFLEFGAPTWPNGFDIAPEWLRREMEAAGELTRVAAEQRGVAGTRHGRLSHKPVGPSLRPGCCPGCR